MEELPSSLPSRNLRQRLGGIEREISDLFFKLLESRTPSTGKGPPRSATLHLSLELLYPSNGHGAPSSSSSSPGEPAGPRADQLFLQLQRAADRYAERCAAFPPGRVYCHWCRSFSCEHSLAPDSRCVFGGYSATGQPRWPELASVLLDRKHPDIESIYRDPPTPIAILWDGDELSREQLPVYGKRSPIFRILGQAALGYLLLPEGGNGMRTPLAATIQVVETQNGATPLALNVLGRLRDGTPAFQAIEESTDARLSSALLVARREIEEISLLRSSRRRRQRERRQRVMAALQRLARNVERIYRQRLRRTQHSQGRHLERGRPASSALKDALHATPQSIYRDIEEKTWVVLGPKNRVHVFNDDALHVTSVVYPGETVRQRTTRGKWMTPRQAEMSAFQEALRRRASAH